MLNKIGKLNKKIKKLEGELKSLKSQFNPLVEELISENSNKGYGVLSEIKNDNFCFIITQQGFDRNNYSYKTGFEKSLEKVNGKTKEILKKELQKTETTSFVKPKFKIINL
tara:strand:- start:548 stop:880 length:333 start_codon:yes stop_codon:yes gene_type:complete